MTWFVLACLVVLASFLCVSELDRAGASLNAISLSLTSFPWAGLLFSFSFSFSFASSFSFSFSSLFPQTQRCSCRCVCSCITTHRCFGEAMFCASNPVEKSTTNQKRLRQDSTHCHFVRFWTARHLMDSWLNIFD